MVNQPHQRSGVPSGAPRHATFHDAGSSDELFRLFVEAVADYAIYLIDTDGRITSWNTGAERMTGYTSDEVLGEPFTMLYTEQDRMSGHAGDVRLASERFGRHEEDGWRMRKDGTRFWAHVVLTAVRDEGRLIGFAKVMHDLTVRKRLDEQREQLLQREQRARAQVTTILESITEGFLAVDHDWRFTYMNRSGRELIRALRPGGSGELIGQNIWDAMPELRGTDFEALHRRAMTERRPLSLESYFAPWNRWFEVRDYPSPDGLSVYFADITERKRAEQEREALLEREQRARAVAERRARDERSLARAIAAVGTAASSGEAVRQIAESAMDATGANGAFAARIFVDRGAVEVVARAGDVPTQFSVSAYANSYTRRAIETRAPSVVPRLADFRDGTWPSELPPQYHDWSMLVVPLIGANEPIGALFLLREGGRAGFSPEESARAETVGELAAFVFRRLELLEESQRRRAEVERIAESRSRLMRGFSHDLKNPLGAADGYAALLEEGVVGKLEPEQCESIRRMRRAIRSSLQLIDDLLELARAEAGEIELKPVPMDAAALAREVAEEFRAQLSAAGLGLEYRASAPAPIESDPARVRQILSNLISNAAKYTKAGSVTVSVSLVIDSGPARPGEWVAVSVSDTGVGVPPDKRDSIFEEFTRLEPGAQQGAGVGLAISRRIARLLGGDITVDAHEPHGSTFRLWLPRAVKSRNVA